MEKGSLNQFDAQQVATIVNKLWNETILSNFSDYIKIPNLSRDFDPAWNTNGLLSQAAQHLLKWTQSQNLKGFSGQILVDKDHAPFIFMEIEGSLPQAQNVLFYGHFDKQPHGEGWRQGFGPTTPIVENDKFYGRGSVDDGYTTYSIIACIQTLQMLGLPHPHCFITIEGNEETNEEDYTFYLNQIKQKMQTIDIAFILDSGGLSYDRIWITDSIRGLIEGNLSVRILKEGVHSGEGSGFVPSSFRILRILLDRVENSKTGEFHQDFQVVIPPQCYSECLRTARCFSKELLYRFPYVQGMQPVSHNAEEVLLNNCWKPAMSIVGADGLPLTSQAGNLLRCETKIKISLRLPPTLDPKLAAERLKNIFEKDPPYGAEVKFDAFNACVGWAASGLDPKVKQSLNEASKIFFQNECQSIGVGGSIPMIKIIQDEYPKCSIIVSGVDGIGSNAHGPDEHLDITMFKKFVGCMAYILTKNNKN